MKHVIPISVLDIVEILQTQTVKIQKNVWYMKLKDERVQVSTHLISSKRRFSMKNSHLDAP